MSAQELVRRFCGIDDQKNAALILVARSSRLPTTPRRDALARLLTCAGLLGVLGGCGGGWQLKGAKAPTAAASTETLAEWPKDKPWEPVSPTDKQSGVFMLDGQPFCFAGTNNYYLIFKSKAMVDDVFANAQKMNLKVMRQWAFLDRGSLDGKIPHLKDDGTKEGVYFQYWDSEAGKPAYNDGENGLQRMDYVLHKARESGLRVVMVLTNNWPDFGGMDQYLLWYGLKRHPDFYTDERVRQAYKDWLFHIVNRVNSINGVAYKDDPTVFAWQLANEPRIRNYSASDSTDGWDRDTITKWASEMSEHLRELDPHHLVSVGDEGMFADGSGGFYDGSDGVDHKALLALPQVDYGTYHLYPEHWGQGLRWGNRWILDHIQAARDVGKPTVLEEYGVIVKREQPGVKILSGWERRKQAYEYWNDLVLLQGGAAAMFWMLAGNDDYTKNPYTDYDHFTVYDPEQDVTGQLLAGYGQRFPTEARACQLAGGLRAKRGVPHGFVTTSEAAGPVAFKAKFIPEQFERVLLASARLDTPLSSASVGGVR